MSNLSSTEIIKWKNTVIGDISNIETSFKKIITPLTNLVTVTKSSDATLSTRFDDLKYQTSTANTKLSTFTTTFKTEMEKYIKAVEKAEANLNEEQKKAIDQFRENGDKIAKLTM